MGTRKELPVKESQEFWVNSCDVVQNPQLLIEWVREFLAGSTTGVIVITLRRTGSSDLPELKGPDAFWNKKNNTWEVPDVEQIKKNEARSANAKGVPGCGENAWKRLSAVTF
jgi:hypothetical protein